MPYKKTSRMVACAALLAISFAALFSSTSRASASELDCLARNIYYEARGEGEAGMVAVAWVTFNRKHAREFPNTLCGVVYDKRHGVQFSWTVANNRAPHGPEWRDARRIAAAVHNGTLARTGIWTNRNIMYYHASHVGSKNRRWFESNLDYVVSVGDHLFYADN